MTEEQKRLLNVARVKIDNGERLTPEERKEILNDEGREFVAEVKRIISENDSPNTRLMCVAANLFGRVLKISAINVQKREALEDRIAALEDRLAAMDDTTKPRLRVVGPTRQIP